MRSLTLLACILVALPGGVGLLRLALHSRYGLDWPLVFMGVGLLLASVSLAIDVGRLVLGLVVARLTFLGGVTVGTTLVVLGLLGVLMPLLS
jgi:hypothetical protein